MKKAAKAKKQDKAKAKAGAVEKKDKVEVKDEIAEEVSKVAESLSALANVSTSRSANDAALAAARNSTGDRSFSSRV